MIMIRLLYKTHGNASPNDKDHLLFHAMKEDEKIANEIIDCLLEENEGVRYACWYADDPEEVFSAYDEPEIAQMHMYIPIISEAYLGALGRYPEFSFEKMSAHGMFVLPLLKSAGIIPAFSARFGSLHRVRLGTDAAKEEIKKQIDRLLVSPELKQEIIKDAFTRRLFLSYRKKDRSEALRILKAVHDTRWGAAAETWFDDFLVPGRDFHEDISQAMERCEAVILAVTPNLLEIHENGRPNYVMEHEYKDAARMGKPVVPVEAIAVDRASMETAFPDIPPFVRVEDHESLEQSLQMLPNDAGRSDADRNTGNPYYRYLLGMAFYLGFRVDKDAERGIQYLQEAADSGVEEAAEQLFYTYAEGYEVDRDTLKAMNWQLRAWEILQSGEIDLDKLRKMKRILFDDGLVGALSMRGRLEEANELCRSLIDAIDACGVEEDSEPWLWKVECLLNVGDIDFGNPLPERSAAQNLQYMLQMTKEAESCLEDYYGDDTAYYYRLKSVIFSSYSEYERMAGDINRAVRFMFMAVKNMKESLNREDSYINRYKMAQMQINLAGCRYLLSQQSGLTSVMRDNFLVDSVMASDEAIRALTQLYEEQRNPTVADQLAQCYLNKSIASKDRSEIREAIEKGLAVIERLERDYPGEGQATKKKLLAAR